MSTPYVGQVVSEHGEVCRPKVSVVTVDESGTELVVAHLSVIGDARSSIECHGWRLSEPSQIRPGHYVSAAEPQDWVEILAHVQDEFMTARDQTRALVRARKRLVQDAQAAGTTLAVASVAMGLTRMRVSQIRREH